MIFHAMVVTVIISKIYVCFTFCADDVYIVYTNDTNPSDNIVMTTERKTFVFDTTACRDITIILSHVPGTVDSYGYKISLGVAGNTKSVIQKMLPEQENHEFSTHNILPCDEDGRSLWLSWIDGVIKVGTGRNYTLDPVFQWTDSRPYTLNAISILSRDPNTVRWRFPRDSGSSEVLFAIWLSFSYF
jgi:Farnesoic acid 0-methyl transferase